MLHQILNQQFKEGKRAEIAAILAIKKKRRKKDSRKGTFAVASSLGSTHNLPIFALHMIERMAQSITKGMPHYDTVAMIRWEVLGVGTI